MNILLHIVNFIVYQEKIKTHKNLYDITRDAFVFALNEITNIFQKNFLLFLKSIAFFAIFMSGFWIVGYLVYLLSEKAHKKIGKGLVANALDAIKKPFMLMILSKGCFISVIVINKDIDKSFINLTNAAVRQIDSVIQITAIAWFLWIFLNKVEKDFSRNKMKLDSFYNPAIGRIAVTIVKVGVILVSMVNISEKLGLNIKATLTFGSIGTAIIGFGAKDMLSNIIGAAVLYTDRPFIIGDEISIPSLNVDGVVEKIGIRITTIRRYNKRPAYLPNSIFISATLENISRITNRQINEIIRIKFPHDVDVRALAASVRKTVVDDGGIDNEQTCMIVTTALGTSIMEMRIYCFTHTTNWKESLEIRQQIIFNINQTIRTNFGATLLYASSSVMSYDDVIKTRSLEKEECVDILEKSPLSDSKKEQTTTTT